LPYLAGITGASPDEASWILTAFNAAYYAMILFSPWMMARVGRKRLMLGALVGFVAVSALLAVTTDYHAFVLLRFAQGLFLGCVYVPAALLFFTSLPTVALRYAPPVFVLISLTAATLGTVVGAFFADMFGGSSIFIPGSLATMVTAFAIALTARAKDTPQRAPARRFPHVRTASQSRGRRRHQRDDRLRRLRVSVFVAYFAIGSGSRRRKRAPSSSSACSRTRSAYPRRFG